MNFFVIQRLLWILHALNTLPTEPQTIIYGSVRHCMQTQRDFYSSEKGCSEMSFSIIQEFLWILHEPVPHLRMLIADMLDGNLS